MKTLSNEHKLHSVFVEETGSLVDKYEKLHKYPSSILTRENLDDLIKHDINHVYMVDTNNNIRHQHILSVNDYLWRENVFFLNFIDAVRYQDDNKPNL